MSSQIGLIGLGTMGKSLARNIASRGYKVSVWNRTYAKVTSFVDEFGADKFYAPQNFEDFINSIEVPRKIILLLPSGEATEKTIEQLAGILDAGDSVMDGANQHFMDSQAFQEMMTSKGIHLLSCGVSGGEEGALKGPSMMPGGPIEAWNLFEPILSAAAAEDFSGGACVAYMGEKGAGHYVKMVHNGIEYAEMQMLAEAYKLLHDVYRLSHDEIADIFEEWNAGDLASYLTEISVEVLRKKEEGKDLLDLILDKAGQKGTGRWTSEEALVLGVPTPSITGAVFMRAFSADKSVRTRIEEHFPSISQAPNMTISEAASHLEKALLAARVSNFEQGFALLRAADEAYGFNLNLSEIVRVWQGGCIIRSKVLKDMHAAFKENTDSLYFSGFAQKIINEGLSSWRLIVQLATAQSVPMLSLSGALTHFEAYSQGRGSANFIQGLRDNFGAHTYERVDKEGSFHSKW
ncbi:MAG: 6-phosphogluconate dehydrogenase [Oceanicoccus sp.]|jgi:6-phosphogluconate dehydrogenase